MNPDRQPPPVPRKGILEPTRRRMVRRRAEPPAPEQTPRKSILPYVLVGLAGFFVLSVAALAALGWTAWRHRDDVRNVGPVIAGDPPAPAAAQAGRPTAPKPAPPAAAPPEDDPDYTNPNPIEPDPRLKVVRFITRSEVDPVGTTRERMDVRGWPELHRDMKALMTGNVRVGGRSFDRPPSLANMTRVLDLDSEPAVLRDVDGICTDDQLWYSVRQEGLARHQGGRWVIRITTDPTAKWEIVSRKGPEVALRGIKKFPDAEAAQIVSELTYTLPAGARKVQLLTNPYRLAYEAPPPAPPATGTADPDVALKPKRVVMSALAQQYNDPTQPLWVGRCELRNTTAETLTDYRIRFRLDDYSDWGGWSVTDNIYPGQTVVDDCRPVLDARALQGVRAPTPATITAEYEYTRPTGARVKRSTTATTKVLEMNAGVYSDVEFDPDLPWFALFKYSPEVMSAFVTGNDPVVRELADRLVAARCDGPPPGSDDEAMKYLEAAFDVLRSNIRYENAEANLIDGLVQQKLKFAREVLQGKAGTCVNTSILYASLVEAAGLEALILCKPGHAYAGAVLPKSRKLVFVETTLCGQGTPDTSGTFQEACEIALKETVEAGQNKTFIKVDVNFYRKKGIAAAEQPALSRTSLDDWGVRVPKTPLAGGAGRSAEPSATLDLVNREPTTRSGVKGLAFHFNVRIANAKGQKCTLMGAFFDQDHHLVRSANPKYAVPPDDILMLTVVLTPTSDDEEIRDVELFLPGDALPGGPGQHVFRFLPQVYLDEPLVKDPKFHEVKMTRR